MREIKFRAWDIRHRKIIGHPICFEAGTFTDHVGLNDLFETFASRKFVLMQYTGLKDKNGREIYEGDILNYKALPPAPGGGYYLKSPSFQRENAAIVKYENGQYVLETDYLLYDKGLSKNLHDDRFKTFEVLGNIYENPELLKIEK